MASTTLPLAVEALVTQWAGVLPDWDVVDGPPIKTQRRKSGAYLMASPTGAFEVPFAQTWAGAGSLARNEQYDIPGYLEVWSGSSNQPSVSRLRADLFEGLALLEAWLRSNVDLGISGYTLRAHLTAGDYTQSQELTGLTIRLTFTVNVQARI